MKKRDFNGFQIATSGTVRDINRRILLNLIRKHQPISRADLARRSGLQRSTVSAIAEDLIADRWVLEGAMGHVPRGRRPTFLHLNVERAGIVGVAIRPIQTGIALASLDTSFFAQTTLPTLGPAADFVSRLCDRILALMRSRPEIRFEGLGVSLPGRVSPRTQKLLFAPNLKWQNLDLKARLERATGLPVELENAANACALAEFWSGRHADSVRNLIAVTVSEGIGVGMVLNGQLVRGTTGAAGEFGHVSFNQNGPLCNCGNRGCWEMYASNVAAVKYYYHSFRADHPGKLSRNQFSFNDLLARARQGDGRAGEALDRMARYLGAGLAMLVSGFSPDVIVIIGEVTEAWKRVHPIILDVIRDCCQRLPVPRILPTDPATQPRLRGAVVLTLQKHFGAP